MVNKAEILRSLVQIRFGGHFLKTIHELIYTYQRNSFALSGMGFEPMPTFVDQNTPLNLMEDLNS